MNVEVFHPVYLPRKVSLIGRGGTTGFASPAADYLQDTIDLNELLVEHPSATEYLRTTGDSMLPLLPERTLMIADRSLQARHQDLVFASVDGSFTVRQYYHKDGVRKLVPYNKKYAETLLPDNGQWEICAVIVFVVIDPSIFRHA